MNMVSLFFYLIFVQLLSVIIFAFFLIKFFLQNSDFQVIIKHIVNLLLKNC